MDADPKLWAMWTTTSYISRRCSQWTQSVNRSAWGGHKDHRLATHHAEVSRCWSDQAVVQNRPTNRWMCSPPPPTPTRVRPSSIYDSCQLSWGLLQTEAHFIVWWIQSLMLIRICQEGWDEWHWGPALHEAGDLQCILRKKRDKP